MLTRRNILMGAGAAAVAARFGPAIAATGGPDRCDISPARVVAPRPSLGDIAARSGRRFGVAVKEPLLHEFPFQRLAVAEANLLGCIYHLKAMHLQGARGQFDFRRADRYVEFALGRSLPIRGHTLVWHVSSPEWMRDAVRTEGFSVIADHIRAVFRHYGSRLYAWDVVNEAVMPSDGHPEGLRRSWLLAELGPDYIAESFKAAREAAPQDVQLFYCANPQPYTRAPNREHHEAVVRLVDWLIAQGAKPDGLAYQGHLVAAYDDEFDERTLEWFMTAIRDRGLSIEVTELDVNDKELRGDVAAKDAAVAQHTRRFLDVVLQFPEVKTIMCWGLTDLHTGYNRWRPEGVFARSLPYDACYQPKPMREAIAAALAAAA